MLTQGIWAIKISKYWLCSSDWLQGSARIIYAVSSLWLIHDVWSIPHLRQLRAAGGSYSSKFYNLLFRIIRPEVVEAPGMCAVGDGEK